MWYGCSKRVSCITKLVAKRLAVEGSPRQLGLGAVK